MKRSGTGESAPMREAKKRKKRRSRAREALRASEANLDTEEARRVVSTRRSPPTAEETLAAVRTVDAALAAEYGRALALLAEPSDRAAVDNLAAWLFASRAGVMAVAHALLTRGGGALRDMRRRAEFDAGGRAAPGGLDALLAGVCANGVALRVVAEAEFSRAQALRRRITLRPWPRLPLGVPWGALPLDGKQAVQRALHAAQTVRSGATAAELCVQHFGYADVWRARYRPALFLGPLLFVAAAAGGALGAAGGARVAAALERAAAEARRTRGLSPQALDDLGALAAAFAALAPGDPPARLAAAIDALLERSLPQTQ